MDSRLSRFRRGPLLGLLAAVSGAGLAVAGGALAAPAPLAPPAQELTAVNALPPGESGFYPVTGQVHGTVSGNPADFGPHTDDQREMYWGFRYKPGGFTRNGTPDTPAPGVQIYRDPAGVPAVYGDSADDVWWGAGYASAQDRLFEMDAVRRLAEGRLAELVGPSAVPDDVQARVLGYTDAEYAAQFAALPRPAQDVLTSYAAGVNAWIATVRTDPTRLPAEYALLSSLPQDWTVEDSIAAGVLITRSVASQGGDEMGNVAALRELEHKYGAAAGRGAFADLFWQDDPKAVTTIPASEGVFDNNDTPADRRAAVTTAMEDYADTLPAGLAHGIGTGDYPQPPAVAAPTAPAGPPAAVRTSVAKAVAAVLAWGEGLHGGSYQLAVGPSRTKDHRPLLESAPQLGWSFPSELWELEVHGGGYDARGVTVPGLPVVGIGYGKRVAWALTTGYSKTIDSFVETTRANPAGSGPRQYLHDGAWHDETCRTETVRYRPAAQGVPAGPPVESVAVPVCRTVHGPVVASAGNLDRSVQYAMWQHEVDTINGILAWDRAQNLDQFAAGVAQVTWNENVMYADADGHIAYWHPGLYPRRSPLVDQRFPAPGSGAFDWRGLRPFAEMPHVVDPKQGYLANWNNKPAVGWNTGDAVSPGGFADHVRVVQDQLAGARNLTFADLVGIDRNVGNSDARSRDLLPPLLAVPRAGLSPAERQALTLLRQWDGRAADPTAGVDVGNTDGPAATLFDGYVRALRAELFGSLPADLTARASAVSLHLYDVTPLDNLALRVLVPSTSTLQPSRDYTGGRSAAAVELAALRNAMRTLTQQFGSSDPTTWRRPHPRSDVCSLTGGAVGPCTTMPYEDRGSYIHLVGF